MIIATVQRRRGDISKDKAPNRKRSLVWRFRAFFFARLNTTSCCLSKKIFAIVSLVAQDLSDFANSTKRCMKRNATDFMSGAPSRHPATTNCKLVCYFVVMTYAPCTRSEHDELFPIMAALEALTGELACTHISDAKLSEIQQLHNSMQAHFEAGRPAESFRSNQDIHQTIVAAAKNTTLEDDYRSLSARLRRRRFKAEMSADRWAASIAEQDEILDVLQHRDGPRLSQVLRNHLSGKSNTIADWLVDAPMKETR